MKHVKTKNSFIFIKLNKIIKKKEKHQNKLKLILFLATCFSLRTRRKNCPPFNHLAKCQFASPHKNNQQSLLWQIPFAPLPIFSFFFQIQKKIFKYLSHKSNKKSFI